MTRDITPAGWPATGVVDEAFAEVRASFDRFCLAAGIEALGTMMEADVTAACGPRHGRDAARRADCRAGARGRKGFQDGKSEIESARVRGRDGGRTVGGRTQGRIGFHGGKIERRGFGALTAARSRSRAGKRRRRRTGSVAGR